MARVANLPAAPLAREKKNPSKVLPRGRTTKARPRCAQAPARLPRARSRGSPRLEGSRSRAPFFGPHAGRGLDTSEPRATFTRLLTRPLRRAGRLRFHA